MNVELSREQVRALCLMSIAFWMFSLIVELLAQITSDMSSLRVQLATSRFVFVGRDNDG